jgi:rfaE bifunctional protein kinase chain/domain
MLENSAIFEDKITQINLNNDFLISPIIYFMNLVEIFRAFNHLNIIIIGDVMLDSYIWGSVDRISPEAPVPVVNVLKQEKRLGGAANVALNIQALGANPILCSVIGDDEEANHLENLLQQQGMTTKGIIRATKRITTIKHRVLAGSQHLLRIDSEVDTPIQQAESDLLINKIKELAKNAHAIIFEDYDKGVLTAQNITEIISFANQNKIPTIVDPKKRNFWAYRHTTLFKPNLKELREGLKMEIEVEKNLASAVAKFRQEMMIDIAFITLSEKGIFIANEIETHRLAAHAREITDVSGAGDTVVSIAALCVALKLTVLEIAKLANLGGGLVCESLGVVPINKEKLFLEAQKVW